MTMGPGRETSLPKAIRSVVSSGNCSGCGLCALLADGVEMTLNSEGYLRPRVGANLRTDIRQAELFAAACPGRRIHAPEPDSVNGTVHPVFGRVAGCWEAWAADADARFRGSSGGVLTALAAWIAERNAASHVIAAAHDRERPTRTASVLVTNRQEALDAAGSRYAPIATLAAMTGKAAAVAAVILKPCEASALRQLTDASGDAAPLLMSFFCAGTPSQNATDGLLEELGLNPLQTIRLKYRGDGWPGNFVASDGQKTVSASYDDTWGRHLGRALQDRCKICVDGTGEHADLSVGDFWRADKRGYPVFSDAPGVSVLIARTARGAAVIDEAIREGIIVARPISLDAVAMVQPLQRLRRRTLLGRLLGRRILGGCVPSYTGYPLIRGALSEPMRTIRALLGSVRRGLPREELN